MTPTRGERNNNPGNIDYNPRNAWVGQIGPEPEGRFARFSEAVYGIRAIGKLLRRYVAEGVASTPFGLISKWAPAVENNTPGYVARVAADLGVTPNALIDLDDPAVLTAIGKAIITVENGRCVYDDATLERGIGMALSG